MKCLILQFKGAGIFDPRFSKDKVVDACGQWDRRGYPRIDVPAGRISKRHISNLLHVLFGERPSPSLRAAIIPRIPAIDAIANDARVRVTSLIDDNGRYPRETKCIRKSVSNSWNTASHDIVLCGERQPVSGAVLSWEYLKQYLGEALFQSFKQLVEDVLGKNFLSERAEHCIELLSARSDETRDFARQCSAANKTPLVHLLNGTTYSAKFNQCGDILCRRTVVKGVESISRIDGTIFVPISDDHLKRIQNGPGTATFLEGGVVFIKGVKEMSENLIADTAEPVE